ncbi:MAG: undecaprenyl-diphosphate phosphatase [Verrucomicrobiota bacterium]|nr:undecaprenyl-diphosphate phosphatase [Verrucomicrobiota bacterium]
MRFPLTLFQALLLGIIQGLTEFFPISSSAHLKLTRFLMGLPEGDQWLYFDLLCHAGTWLALVWFLRREVWEVLRSPRKIALFSLALAPLVPAYFFLKPLRVLLSAPSFTGYFLLGTSALLFLASKAQERTTSERKWRSVVCIGGMQALALLPGLSRSGSTIATAKFCGWSWVEGARFSFLLAVPTILGGEVLESYRLLKEANSFSWSAGLVGFLAAFGVGLVAVRFVFWVYEKGFVKPFAWYCCAMGFLMLWVWHA